MVSFWFIIFFPFFSFFLEYVDIMHTQDPSGGNKVLFESYKEGRKNYYVYSTFIKHFVKPVVGINKWNDRLHNLNLKPKMLFTASDEAFALVVLSNYYKYWWEIFEKNGYKIPTKKRKRDSDEEDTSTLENRPLYTDASHSTKEGGRVSKQWSIEGYQAFNDFHDKCRKDRKKFPDFNKKFLEQEREEEKNQKRNSRKKVKTPLIVPARESLLDSDDESDHIRPGRILLKRSEGLVNDDDESEVNDDEMEEEEEVLNVDEEDEEDDENEEIEESEDDH